MTEAETTRALALPGPVSSELAAMGSRKEVRELVRRIQTQAPGGMKLTPAECVTLAQYSFSLGANPLVGEAWLLKNQRSGEVLGVMPGMALYRRRADEKDERTGDVRWLEPEVITDPDEWERLGVPEDAFLAMRVRLYRQSQTKAHAEAAKTLSEAGAPWEDIKAMLGLKPYTAGIGWITRQEVSQRGRGGPQEGPYQIAERRAEKHALKQVYSLPFGFIPLAEGASVPDGATLEDYVHEGEFREMASDLERREIEREAMTPEERKAAADAGSDALFGAAPQSQDMEPAEAAAHQEYANAQEPKPRMWSEPFVEDVRRLWETTGVMPPNENRKHLIMLLNLTPFDETWPPSAIIAWGKVYRGSRDQDVPSKAAAVMATAAVPAPF